MEPLIEALALRRRYGTFEALRGIDFAIRGGEIVGLLGPNGAGKSTCMKLLTGWLAPTGGAARVGGRDVLTDPLGVRRQVGYLPEGAPAQDDQRVGRWLAFGAEVRGLGAAERSRAVERVAADCGLDGRMDQRIGTLSRGYRQRVGLASALLHDPPVLVLDEPTTGLDPNQVVEIRALIRQLAERRTVILSTHVLPEVQATCDRALILHEGRLVADGAVEALARGSAGQRVVVGLAAGKVVAAPDVLAAELAAIPGVVDVTPEATDDGLRFAIRTSGEDVRAAVFRWAVAGGHVLVELRSESRSLEEVFRHLTVGET